MRLIATLLIGFLPAFIFSQLHTLTGAVHSAEEVLPFATVQVAGTSIGTVTDENGNFTLTSLPQAPFDLSISFTGYRTKTTSLNPAELPSSHHINVSLFPTEFEIDAVVVTGTKTFKRQTNSPVIVQLIDQQTLQQTQSCNLAEGLQFQPGLRVETNCQTCNYTQLRMNGLGGSYSQILINGRPIFSPLTGLYGLEQIPSTMIERIEIVRGGGSALYGSSAIGGTVNVITKLPKKNQYGVTSTYQNVNGNAHDEQINAFGSLISSNDKFGGSIFFSHRFREAYDHNGDNFSELPEIMNNSGGVSCYYQPTEDQKLEGSISILNEYRIGGEMLNKPSHLLGQAEERTHHVYVASLDYQNNFNDRNSLIAYASGQLTKRAHFTGVKPDEPVDVASYTENPPYGSSTNTTWQLGAQYNHKLPKFLGGINTLTLGSEFVADDVFDEIESYQYLIDQTTYNFGLFAQSDWEITPQFSLLTGARLDQHNFLDKVVVSPRISALYKLKRSTQFRLSYGSGFRAPQAFDADLHIAFAGGGVSRIQLDPNLTHEKSHSLSGSINYDKSTEKFVAGFTLEAFYTRLNNVFFLTEVGSDQFGLLFEKQNGSAANVSGLTVEGRANYNRKIQIEAGYTFQKNTYENAITYIEDAAPTKVFLRTPNHYGYATVNISPKENYYIAMNYVYTGSMRIAHFAGAPEQDRDEFIDSKAFGVLSFKTNYDIPLRKIGANLALFGGVKNITNAYQNDFDTGKNRDSNFVYGPSAPRTFYLGLGLSSF